MGQMVGNPKVTVIPARPRMGIGRKNDERQKIRVAAYCRVSTDSDEQATSYEAQIEHYTAFISPMAVSIGMRNDLLPIGFAIHNEERDRTYSESWSYHIIGERCRKTERL